MTQCVTCVTDLFLDFAFSRLLECLSQFDYFTSLSTGRDIMKITFFRGNGRVIGNILQLYYISIIVATFSYLTFYFI